MKNIQHLDCIERQFPVHSITIGRLYKPKEKNMEKEITGVPLSFGMALASRPDALLAFVSMPPQKKKEWVEKAEHIETKRHMHSLLDSLACSTPDIQ